MTVRLSAAYIAVIALVIALAGYFTIAIEILEPPWSMSADGSPPDDGGSGNVLQPIGPKLTWIYRTEGIWPGGVDRRIVLGSEHVDGEDRWLIEHRVGSPDAIRYEIVNRNGDLWLLSWAAIGDDGDWERTTPAEPQLWQPDARDVEWTDASFGPGREMERTMRRGGTRKVLGTRRQLWLIESPNPPIANLEPPVTTIAEGIGPIEFDGASYDGSGPLRLVEFRTTPPPLHGTFEARSRHGFRHGGEALWTLDVGPDGSGSIGSTVYSPAILRWAVRGGDTIELAGEPGGWPFRWLGRMEVVGLLGRASFRDQSYVLEFVPR